MLDFPHLRGSLPGMDPLGNTFLRRIPPEMSILSAVSERNPIELLTRIPRIVTFQKTKIPKIHRVRSSPVETETSTLQT
jgi:hypothetical protein